MLEFTPSASEMPGRFRVDAPVVRRYFVFTGSGSLPGKCPPTGSWDWEMLTLATPCIVLPITGFSVAAENKIFLNSCHGTGNLRSIVLGLVHTYSCACKYA